MIDALEFLDKRRAFATIRQSEELERVRGSVRQTTAADFMRKQQSRPGERRPAFQEVYRIIDIPCVDRRPAEDRELMEEALVLLQAREDGFEFFDEQIDGLLEFDAMEGLFGPIAVGKGKTFITILCAAIAYHKGVERSVLHVPAKVYGQLVTTDIPNARRLFNLFNLPITLIGGEPIKRRRALTTSGRKGCYVIPHSLVSRKDASEMYEAIQPDLIIIDEAHHFKNRRAACTMRLVNYMSERRKRKIHTQLVALSGTITLKSIMDYHHLLVAALGDGAPLPLTQSLAKEWGAVIDARVGADGEETKRGRSKTGPMLPLVTWARQQDGHPKEVGASKRGLRAAYRFRLTTSPGVVANDIDDLGVSLTIRNRPATSPSQNLLDLAAAVEEDWTTPNGDPIEFGIHKFKWLYELCSGFYNLLKWPMPELFAQRKGISTRQAAEQIGRACEHHIAHCAYSSELRQWLRTRSKTGLDTPMLVGAEIKRNGAKKVGKALAELWHGYKEMEFEGMPQRDSLVVRVDDYKIVLAQEWAKEKGHGIMWYWHNAIGDWLAETIPDAMHCAAGAVGNKRIFETKGKLVVASMAAHGEGKNLQFHENQLFVQWPSNAGMLQQVLGRLHRPGQQADELDVYSCLSLEFDEMLLAATLNDALYIHQTTKSEQKAIIAGWEPVPKLFPHSVLEERGFRPKGGVAIQRLLYQKFGATL